MATVFLVPNALRLVGKPIGFNQITVAVTLLFALLLNGCTGLFFHPSKQHVTNPRELGLSYRDIWLTAEDGVEIHGWLLAPKQPAKGSILFLHGNAENISTHIMSVFWLPAEGYQVLVLDYRGYGKSKGRATLAGLHIDAVAGFEFLAEQENHKQESVTVFGQSLGGSIALQTAATLRERVEVKAVVIDSAFSSYRGIVRDKLQLFLPTSLFRYPLSMLINGSYDLPLAASEVSPKPILFIHGEGDQIVPAYHSQVLYDAAKEPKQLWLVDGVRHIESLRMTKYRKQLLDFLAGKSEGLTINNP